MSIDLMPWLILWAVITSGVLLLALWRLMVVRREEQLGMHVTEPDAGIVGLEERLATRLCRIDRWGKILTVVSAILVLAIGAAWLYNGWLKSNEVIR